VTTALFRRAAALAFLSMPGIVAAQPAGQPPAAEEKPAAQEKPAASPAAREGDNSPFKTFDDKLSYAVGLNAGRMIQEQGLHPDPELFAKGFKDSFKEGEALLTDEEITQIFTKVQQDMHAKAQANAKKLQASWDTAFSDQNQASEAKTTKSGLKYEVIEQGKGPRPKAGDQVVVHYVGKLPSGKVFDSSVARGEPLVIPVKSGPGGVIEGWVEGLKLMPVGSKYKLYIPANLAYGKEGRPPAIPANQDLVFEVQLVDVASSNSGAPGQQQGSEQENAPK
jgi:FKBP-type peptidyl-prolyl cis-trans isomerase FklB